MPFIEGFFGFFGGKWYKSGLFGATTHKYIDFTALNAGSMRPWEKENLQLVTNIEKSAHDMPTSPSNHVCNQLEL